MNKALVCVPVYHDFFKYMDKLLPHAEALELKKPFTKIDTNLPKTFHANGLINNEFDELLDPIFLNYLNDEKINIFSFDIGPSSKEVITTNEGHWVADSPVLNPDELIRRAKEKIIIIKQNFNGEVVTENLDYHEGGAYEHVCDPTFITRFIKELDVGLLLDIAHARVSASALGYDVWEYIKKLPLSLVKEIHLSKAYMIDGKVRDSHEVPTQDDFEILRKVLKKTINAKYVVIEYYKDLHEILRATEQLGLVLKENASN